MAYATVADIALSEKQLVELTDDTKSGAVDANILAGVIGRADEKINDYLRSRYHVPFTTPPASIVRTSAMLTKYFLFERRGLAKEPQRREYDDAMAYLKDLATGRAVIDEEGQPADLDRSPSRILSNKTASSAVFPKSVLDRY